MHVENGTESRRNFASDCDIRWDDGFLGYSQRVRFASSIAQYTILIAVPSVCIAHCEGHSKLITQFHNLNHNQLITSAADGTIRVWDWTGAAVSQIAAHDGAVRGFYVSGERAMVSVGMDGRTKR